nr:hypothetical protein [Anaerohalosphaeraceae bacterium]
LSCRDSNYNWYCFRGEGHPGYFTSIVLMVAADVDDGDVSERLKCPPGTMESGVGIPGENDDIAVRLCRLECFEFIMQIAENEQLHVLILNQTHFAATATGRFMPRVFTG